MEKLVLELNDVGISFLDQPVFTIDRIAVHQFDRIGIVGKNGAGKSTLLKLIRGDLSPNRGHVKRHIEFGYFDQKDPAAENTADYKLAGELAIPEHAVGQLSGGEQTRLKLANLFTDYYEGLLLDEPTTHLDADGVKFVIDTLNYYAGALILVSHDRHVLDQLTTKIWEIEDGKIKEYSGNYSDYAAQKELEEKQHYESYDQYMKEKNRLIRAAAEKMNKADKITQASKRISKRGTSDLTNKMFMTKSKDTSQKSIQRAAKAMEQRIDQLEEVKEPAAKKTLHFQKRPSLALHNKFPIIADHFTLANHSHTLLSQASFQFPLGKVIAITGANGVGKSTLLQHIYNREKGLDISPRAVFGFYEQLSYQFHKSEPILTYMKQQSDENESTIRSVLHKMDFIGNAINKNVQQLSGGESIRLILCQLFLGRYNILLLDEPTNFLDLYCIRALEEFIMAYDGTILIVSHDQRFIERVADCVYTMENKKLLLTY